MKATPCRLAVLLSGGGTTMVNLAQRIEAGEIPARIEVVVSSRKNALGLDRAEARGFPTHVLNRKKFKTNGVFDDRAYSRALADLIAPYEPDLVVLAGFMTRLTPPLLERYDVMNVHPALLPAFGGEGYYGHRVHEAVLEAGCKVTGATVHFADAEYDHGPIVLQEAVPVEEDDTPDTLAARVQAAERVLYPEAVKLYAEGRLERQNGRVHILRSGADR